MEDLRTFIGQRIREARRALDITQLELANKLMCEPPLVSRYERGTTMPTIEQLLKISAALGVMPSDLIPAPENPETIKAKYFREVIKAKISSISDPKSLEKIILFIDENPSL